MAHRSNSHQIAVVVLAAAGFAVGCARAPVLTDSSTSAIDVMEDLQADRMPEASLYLYLAKEELKLALRLSSTGKDDQARSMLRRTEADAELAVVLSHLDSERHEAQESVERVRQLRQDNP